MADPIVVLHLTDIPFINGAAIVTRNRLESIGFKVILKAMDWSTNVVVRARKEPPEKGGWSVVHTWLTACRRPQPRGPFRRRRRRSATRGSAGQTSHSSRSSLSDWVRATDLIKRKQLADEVQRVALSEVTYVPWGEWVQPTAFRKNVRASSSSPRRSSGTCESLEVKSPRVETAHAAITQRRVY